MALDVSSLRFHKKLTLQQRFLVGDESLLRSGSRPEMYLYLDELPFVCKEGRGEGKREERRSEETHHARSCYAN